MSEIDYQKLFDEFLPVHLNELRRIKLPKRTIDKIDGTGLSLQAFINKHEQLILNDMEHPSIGGSFDSTGYDEGPLVNVEITNKKIIEHYENNIIINGGEFADHIGTDIIAILVFLYR